MDVGFRAIFVIALCFYGLQISSAESDCGAQYEDWLEFQGYCYVVEGRIGSAYTWHEADKYCRQSGALLASIHSDDENEFIAKQTRWTRLHPAVWLGLNTLTDSTLATWLDGSVVDFTRVNLSVIDNSRRCAILDSPDPNRRWLFTHCDTTGSFVCKRLKDASPVTILPPVTPEPPGNCPQDWTKIGQKCFRIFSSNNGHNVNHSTARSQCVGLGVGHDLASIHTPEDNLHLTTLTANEGSNLWIGLSRITFTTFGWTDNTQLEFTNWAPGEPSSVAEGCVELITSKFRSGYWNDNSCRQTMGYICQRYPDPTAPTVPPPIEDCENGFQRFDKACYKAFQGVDQVTWYQAVTECRGHGGHLASINSGQEMAFLKKSFFAEAEGELWIGLKTTKDHVYQWSNDWPVTYLEFGKGFQAPVEQCAFINMNGTWSMENCDNKRGFLCKISEESHPDYPELDLRPCPSHVSPLVDVGLEYCYAIRNYGSWAGAHFQCIRNDTQLASFHHQHELELLAPHLIHSPEGVWIGMLRKYHGRFEWVDGTKEDLNVWDENEPSTKSKQDCGVLSPITMKVTAEDCSQGYTFICKLPKGANL